MCFVFQPTISTLNLPTLEMNTNHATLSSIIKQLCYQISINSITGVCEGYPKHVVPIQMNEAPLYNTANKTGMSTYNSILEYTISLLWRGTGDKIYLSTPTHNTKMVAPMPKKKKSVQYGRKVWYKFTTESAPRNSIYSNMWICTKLHLHLNKLYHFCIYLSHPPAQKSNGQLL